MHLADFPSGRLLFLDANCLIYHFLSTHPVCTTTLYRCEIGEIIGVTSVSVVAEVKHQLMVMEAVNRFHLSPKQALHALQRHPQQVRSLRVYLEALSSLHRLRLTVLAVSADMLMESQQITHEHGLLTNDALIVATMRAHHITHLASNDTDFARLPGITLWRP